MFKLVYGASNDVKFAFLYEGETSEIQFQVCVMKSDVL